MSDFGFVVPGRLDQITGGYLYDRRMIEGLRGHGRDIAVHELSGRFPDADAAARSAAAALLAGLPDGARLCIDGLALPGFDPVLAEHAGRLRVIALVHHPLALETGLSAASGAAYAALEARLLRLCRGVLAPSGSSAAALREYGLADERMAIVPPGLDRPQHVPRRRSGGPVRLLSVGTVTPRKGHVLLVEALAAAAALPWHLTIIGSLERDPETVRRLRAAIAAAGLEGRATLLGECPPARVSAAYADADVFVLPSYYEGYGMVFGEAMAYGLPIVATTGGAIPGTVPAAAGILVPPGDRAALAVALAKLIDHEELRENFAHGAAEAAAVLPDWRQASFNFGVAVDRLSAD
jgi:glycosyltransferase involved in cell wall biosynthesis